MAGADLVDLLRRRALHWLSQREQSEAELRHKLQRLLVTLRDQQATSAGEVGSPASRSTQKEIPRPGEAQHRASPHEPASLPDDTALLIDQLINWLREREYLSNRRFVEARLRTRQNRYGAQRIQSELAQHGLSLSEDERQQLAQTELSRAHAVWLRKFGPEPPTDLSSQAAQARFLAQRGFSGSIVRQVLRGRGAG